jgi:hypothetical protein
MPSIVESLFFVFVANSSPIDCPLSSINHPVLIAKKPFEFVRLLFTDFKFLKSGAFLIVELNQAFWIRSLSPCHANLSLRGHHSLQADNAGRVVKNSHK